MDVPVLETERLLLTIPGPRAAAASAQFSRENRQHLAPWSVTARESDFNPQAWETILARRIDLFRDDKRYSFCIFARETGADGPLLGYLNFSEIVRGVFQACYMGYALAEGAQGNGYMTEACRAGIGYMFERARLHRIMANYMPQNARSAAVLQRLGFTIEGRAKEYLFLAGAWQDHVLTSLVNPSRVEPA